MAENKDITVIEWEDSYGAHGGWQSIEEYMPELLVCTSCGFKVYEDEKVVALAPNFATSTTYTPIQANGMIVIPKRCILRVITSCFSFESELKPQHS